MKASCISILAFIFSTFIPMVSSGDELVVVQKEGDPANPTGGRFYGYYSSSLGPGDDAFDKLKKLADESHSPLFLVYAKEGCSSCNALLQDLKAWSRAYPTCLAYGKTINGFFRSGTFVPKACEDANTFIKNQLKATAKCHIVAMYGLCEDGTIFAKTSTATTYDALGTWKLDQTKAFQELAKKHLYVPPKSSLSFGLAALNADKSTARVYVPVVRTNDFAKAETDWLKVTYPDKSTVTNEFSLSSQDRECEVPVFMSVNGASKWTQGGKVILELLNTNKISVATSYIHFVDAPQSGLFNPAFNKDSDGNICGPDVPGGGDDNDARFGRWTLDFDEATNIVYAANSYLQPDTNQIEVISVPVEFSYTVSNRYDTVYTNNVSVFSENTEVVNTNWLFECIASNRVTNVYTNDLSAFGTPLIEEITTNFVVSVTNTTTTVYGSDVSETERNITTQEIAIEFPFGKNFIINGDSTNQFGEASVLSTKVDVAMTNIIKHVVSNETYNVVTTNVNEYVYEFVGTNRYYTIAPGVSKEIAEIFDCTVLNGTNQVYIVVPGEAQTTTNLYTSERADLRFSVAVTNTVNILPVDELHPEPTVETIYQEEGVRSEIFEVADTLTFVTASRDLDPEEKGVTFIETLTNRVYCVFTDTMVTNECTDARQVVPVQFQAAVTNYTHITWTNDAHSVCSTVTEYKDIREVSFKSTYTETYDSVTTNTYQHGAKKFDDPADNGRAEYAGLQAFTLALRMEDGDEVMAAFAEDVVSSTNFAAWTEANQIVPVMLSPEALSSEWKSRNGLSKSDMEDLIEEAAEVVNAYGLGTREVVLIRPNGELVGHLSVHFKDGRCDVTENIARLDELLEMANEDSSEGENNWLNDTMNLAYEDESAANTLHISDRIDVFKLVDVPTNAAVAFTLECASTNTVTLCVLDENGGVIEPRVDDVWVLDTTNAYLAVSAYTDEAAAENSYGGKSKIEYTLKAHPAEPNAGKIGFVNVTDEVTENGKSNTVYQLKVARTGGITGDVTVRVCLDTVNTTATDERYVWTNDVELTWKDLEIGEKIVEVLLKGDEHCFGERNILTFTNSVVSADSELAESGKKVFRLIYKEDDEPRYGNLSFYKTVPGVSTNGIVYIAGDKNLEIFVDRVNGSNYEIAGTLKASYGTLSTNTLVWSDFDEEPQSVSLSVPKCESGSKNFTVTLTGSDGVTVIGGNKITCCVLADNAPWFNAINADWELAQYVSFSNSVALVQKPEKWTVLSADRLKGTLPAGVSAKVDKVNGAIVFSGIPTRGAEEHNSLWRIVFRDEQGRTNYSLPIEVNISVLSLGGTSEDGYNDALNPGFKDARSWTSLPVTNNAGRLVGLLNMTVAKNGRTSARYTKTGGVNVSFSAKGLSSVDLESGDATICVTHSVRGVDYALNVILGADGSMHVDLIEGEKHAYASLPEGSEPWSRKHSAEKWGGNYAVALVHDDLIQWHSNTLCFGSAALQVRFASASQHQTGRAQYAGVLPNGKTVSGTATFVPCEDVEINEVLTLPVFYTSSTDTLGAQLSVSNGVSAIVTQSEEISSYWHHEEKNFSCLTYENDYCASGSRFDADNTDRTYRFYVNNVDSGALVRTSGKKMTVANKGGDFALAFNLNGSSGQASGTFKYVRSETDLRKMTVNWRGVVTPGWEPIMAGAYWRNITTNVINDVTGKTTKRTVREGGSVSLIAVE